MSSNAKSSNKISVIGEGAYGCIHKPSLTCKEAKINNYKNKISKVLKQEYARIELNEYKSIDNADKSHEYHLEKPVECGVKNTPSNISAIEKCKRGTELLNHLDDLSLLIMEDGGINLNDYVEIMHKWPATLKNVENTERFILELHRIFHGIKVFSDKDILHFDIKPQNIVYIPEKQRMNIIDFGLTVSAKHKLAEIENSTNGMALYHWSYPFEFYFLNKNDYQHFAKLTKTKKSEYYLSILSDIENDPKAISSKAIKSFYSYVIDEKTESEEFREHMAGFYQTLVSELTMKNYGDFIEKSIYSVDVYGLGITLLYILKETKHLLKKKLYNNLHNLGYSMIQSQLSKRVSIDEALSTYETILNENGIMAKYNVSFADHKIVEGEAIPKRIKQSIETIDINSVILNKKILNKNAVSVDISHKNFSSAIDKRSKTPKKRGKKSHSITKKKI